MIGFVFNYPRDDGLVGKNHGNLLQRASRMLHGLDGGDEKWFSVIRFPLNIWIEDENHP
jgi:hypothetical protein